LRAATSILLFHFLKRCLSLPVAMLAAIYWAYDYYIHAAVYQQGLETGIAVFSLVLFLYLLQKIDKQSEGRDIPLPQIALLGVSATIFVFSRLDLVFLAGIFGLWIVFRRYPLRYLLLLDVLVIVCSLAGAVLFRIGLPEYFQYEKFTLAALALSLGLKIPVFLLFGLYTQVKSLPGLNLILRSALAVLISAVLLYAGLAVISQLHLLEGNFPRSIPIIDAIITLSLLLIVRTADRILTGRNTTQFSITSWAEWRTSARSWLPRGLVYFGILGGSIGAYMLWNKNVFGSYTPVSGQVKNWWGSFASNVYGGSAKTALSFFGVNPEGDFNAWAPFTSLISKWHERIVMRTLPIDYDLRYALMLLIILSAAGTILILMNHQRAVRLTQEMKLIPLFVGAQLQILSYNLTGYAGLKEWYWVAQLVFLLLAGSLVVDIISQPVRKLQFGSLVLILMVLYWGASMAIAASRILISQMYNTQSNTGKPLMGAAAFIEEYTEPGSIVGMTGGGNVGDFIQNRTIINMDGLINSYPYFLAHRSKKGSDYLAALGMNYIFANPDFLETQPYRGQYSGRLEVIDYYGGKAIMRFASTPNSDTNR
jgi:hypothetical protein